MPAPLLAPAAARAPLLARLAGPLLRVPLAVKLAGANALVVGVAAVAVAHAGAHRPDALPLAAILGAALAAGVAVNVLLVRAALRPLRALERTAALVVAGDLAARVPRSPLADREMARVGNALNTALDALGAERERLRALAAAVIRAGDAEGERVARELHDSAAQTLAALALQAGTAARRAGTAGDAALAEQLEAVRELSADAMEEVRSLSLTVYPRVLDDLGLAAALAQLGRSAGAAPGPEVEVAVEGDAALVPPEAAATLYRVAEEALANARLHAAAARVRLRLAVEPHAARLTVDDDGRGFAPPPPGTRAPGLGLFVMHERAALLDGRVRVESAPGSGTRVVAELPLAHRATPLTLTAAAS
jgi:signal transduction histidine kinase